MNHQNMLIFFQYQREIFGICPCCGDFFRLSDCKVFQDKPRKKDWLDSLRQEDAKLDALEEKLDEDMKFYAEVAREKGRKEAGKKIKKLDKTFLPQKLNPDDAKVIFHPVDFVVFNGMKKSKDGDGLKNIVLLDGAKKSAGHRSLQGSIRKTIEQGHYEWLTLRVQEDGKILEED
jgi:predicted Holliday junction resolvase-like endonuclease